MILIILLAVLALMTVPFAVVLIRAAAAQGGLVPRGEAVVLGAVTNFFDTLGIGSFAPTMAWFKFRRLVPDRLIAPTMLCGHALPTVAESAIFLLLLGVRVDALLLCGCILACVAGMRAGIPLVARLPLRAVQAGVGFALLIAAVLYVMANLRLMPLGGTASTLPPLLTAIAIAASFAIGLLANFGVGTYAPTLIILSLMGMDPRLAFPIMASSGAIAILGAGRQYLAQPGFDARLAWGMAIGGIPAVFVAAFIVKEMPVEPLRWLVVVVALYAAATMLRAAMRPAGAAPQIAAVTGS